jgi:acetylornithine deacetylase/succinyl-diaminopimelate desuccinylase
MAPMIPGANPSGGAELRVQFALMLDPVLRLASELVKIPSHPGVPRQELAVARRLAEFLEQSGLEPRLIEVREGRPNLLACVDSGRPGPHLVLCGHTDTVPLNREGPGVGMSGAVVGDALQGRGAADMKGALAAMAGALASLHAGPGLGAGKVTLAAVIDEEMESLGAEALIENGLRAAGAIIGEPTENRLALGHKGLEWLEIAFTGRAAHGGTPEAGINAINAAAHFITLIEERLVPALNRKPHPLLGPPTINCGTISGGDQPSTVAAHCVLRVDRRSVPGESYASLSAELRELLDDVERRRPGVLGEVRRMPGGMAKLEHLPSVIDSAHPLARAARTACASVTGAAQIDLAFPAWTDAGLFSNFASIPCVILGPGDLRVAHTPWESVPLAQIRDAVSIYREAAQLFCSG